MEYMKAEIKAFDDSNDKITTVSGYASVFGNIDSHGDVITKGAFKETVGRTNDRKINLYSSHSMDARDLLGSVTSLYEDDYGLFFEANISSADSAQDIMLKAREGHLDEISIGFFVTDQEFTKQEGMQVRKITGIELVEISLVSRASNSKAKVLMVKDDNSVCKQEIKMEEKNNEEFKAEETEIEVKETNVEKTEIKEEVNSNAELMALKAELAELKETVNKPIRQTVCETGETMDHKENNISPELKESYAFVDYLSGKINKYEYHIEAGLEEKALRSNVEADGGALVPTRLANKIKQDRAQINRLQARVERLVLNGPFDLPDFDYSESLPVHAENNSITVDDISDAFGKTRLDPQDFGIIVKISKRLIRRNQVEPLEGFIAGRYARKFADQLESHLFNGTGHNQPLGIVQFLDDEGVNTVNTTASASLANMDYDDIVDLVMKLDEEYRSPGVIFGSKNFITRVMKLKDSNNMPIWQPPVGDRPATLLGKALFESKQLADGDSAGETVAVFCDPKEYLLGMEEDFKIEVLRELYAANNQIGLKMMASYDGTPMDVNAFARIETN